MKAEHVMMGDCADRFAAAKAAHLYQSTARMLGTETIVLLLLNHWLVQ